ncbi:MAG: DUF4231 domain-containing protein, partial [Roseomonas sp.]|nr:DUF4231 domain-containing protein [Roseomonas sp.]
MAAVAGALAAKIGVNGAEASPLSMSGLFALTAGAAAAMSTFFGRHMLSEQSQTKRIVARATAENLQSECYRYAAGIGAYAASKQEAAKEFDSRTNELVAAARHQGIEPPAKAPPSSSRLSPPEDMSADWYAKYRLADQQEWYVSRSEEHRKKARMARRLGLLFGMLAALLGFLGSVAQAWLSPDIWVQVMVAAAQFLQHADHPDIGRGVQDRQNLSVPVGRQGIGATAPPGLLFLGGKPWISLDPVGGCRGKPCLGSGCLRRKCLSVSHVKPRLAVGDVAAGQSVDPLSIETNQL